MNSVELAGATTSATAREPYAVYRDSGVKWIGEIPSQWDTSPLKRIASLVTRGIGPDYVAASDTRVINQACIQWDGLHLENVKYQSDESVVPSDCRIHRSDLLLNSTGTGTLGRAAVFACPGTFIADSHVTIVRVRADAVEVRYLY